MQRTHFPVSHIERNTWLFAPAILLGIASGLFIDGYLLIDFFPAESKQALLLTGVASLLAAAGGYMLAGWVRTRFSELSVRQRIALTASSILIGSFLFFGGTDQWQSSIRYVTFLLPSHRLQLSVFPTQPFARTTVLWFNTSLGDVSYDALDLHGWERESDQLILQNPADNAIYWTGKTGENSQVVLGGLLPDGQVSIRWDGEEQVLSPSPGKFTYLQTFDVPWYAARTFILVLGVVIFVVLSLALCLLVWQKRTILVETIGASMARAPRRMDAADGMLLFSLLLLALALRAPNLANVFPAVDEYYQLIAARQILESAALGSVYPRGLWLVTMPVAAAMRIFGNELWAARLMGVLFNVLAVLPLYLFTRKINRPVAVLSALLFATSPWIIAFARVVREYAYYPFYFYWTVFVMVSFIEGIPQGFVFIRAWRELLKPRIILLGLGLVIPPILALYIDPRSTFRTILIAYLIFGVFVLQRFDFRSTLNLPILLLVSGIILAGAYRSYIKYLGHISSYPTLNTLPLQYFFPNPPQQWYFNRLAVIAGIGFLGALLLSYLMRRVNIIPLFLATLYAGFLGIFTLFSRTFFHPRHLLTTQLWYIVVAAIGLYVTWQLVRVLLPVRGLAAQVLAALLLGLSTLNPQQILAPMLSKNPDVRITEDYHDDLSLVQAYLVAHVKENEVLISTVYGLYAAWQEQPKFNANYRITTQTSRQVVSAIVDQNPAGWIVVDQIRLGMGSLAAKDFSAVDDIEYIGLYGDQYVWHWERPKEQTDGSESAEKGQ